MEEEICTKTVTGSNYCTTSHHSLIHLLTHSLPHSFLTHFSNSVLLFACSNIWSFALISVNVSRLSSWLGEAIHFFLYPFSCIHVTMFSCNQIACVCVCVCWCLCLCLCFCVLERSIDEYMKSDADCLERLQFHSIPFHHHLEFSVCSPPPTTNRVRSTRDSRRVAAPSYNTSTYIHIAPFPLSSSIKYVRQLSINQTTPVTVCVSVCCVWLCFCIVMADDDHVLELCYVIKFVT